MSKRPFTSIRHIHLAVTRIFVSLFLIVLFVSLGETLSFQSTAPTTSSIIIISKTAFQRYRVNGQQQQQQRYPHHSTHPTRTTTTATKEKMDRRLDTDECIVQQRRRSFLLRSLTTSILFGVCVSIAALFWNIHPVNAFSTAKTTTTTTTTTATFQPAKLPTRQNAFVTTSTTLSVSSSSLSSSSTSTQEQEQEGTSNNYAAVTTTVVAYKTIALPLAGYGINIPVACWYPSGVVEVVDTTTTSSTTIQKAPLPPPPQYNYQISVRKIGELIAKWDFIPNFVTRKFSFTPGIRSSSSTTTTGSTKITFVDGSNIPIPKGQKVVFLAHGFLGSRLDMSHIAEDLASKGFVCVSPEYPESLEASYPTMSTPEGEILNRKVITDRLLQYVKDTIQPTSYAAIGHSLGCGTVLQMGDETWDRIFLGIGRAPGLPGTPIDTSSRFPLPNIGGRVLFISSTNDGAVKFGSNGAGIVIPEGYTILHESDINSFTSTTPTPTTDDPSSTPSSKRRLVLPDRVALIFDRKDGPNHISYLSENVNEAMITFLAPLLPLAAVFNIPVLDFDKYVISRDSIATAGTIQPLISNFLLQQQ
jgi:cytoskeletal protein RodZ